MIKILNEDNNYTLADNYSSDKSFKEVGIDINDFLPEIKEYDKSMKITNAILLSSVEAEKYLTKEDRKYNHWWWLRSPGYCQNLAARVDIDGSVYYCGFYVNIDNFCVRPALKISNLKSSNFNIGDKFEINGYNFKIISDNLAWMYKQDIGKYYFREDSEAKNANDYEYSDVKKYVDNWFNEKIKPYL